jgi:hypothetical protein
VEPQQPNAEASDAHRRRHMKPCDANGVLGGAEQKVKGSFLQDPPTVPACTVDEANMFASFPQDPASAQAGQPTVNGLRWRESDRLAASAS